MPRQRDMRLPVWRHQIYSLQTSFPQTHGDLYDILKCGGRDLKSHPPHLGGIGKVRFCLLETISVKIQDSGAGLGALEHRDEAY